MQKSAGLSGGRALPDDVDVEMNAMITNGKKYMLAEASAAAGLLGLLLRWLLYRSAVDDRGLLVFGHPLAIAGWLLPLALLCLLIQAVLKMPKASPAVPLGAVPGVGCILMTFGLLALSLQLDDSVAILRASRLLGLLAAVCMALAGISRFLNQRPFFLLMVIPGIFFAVFLVGMYQKMRGIPQMDDCLPMIGASVVMMLYSYHQAAMDLGCSTFRSQIVLGCLTVYFCLTSLVNGESPVFYLCGAGWALMGILSLREERTE